MNRIQSAGMMPNTGFMLLSDSPDHSCFEKCLRKVNEVSIATQYKIKVGDDWKSEGNIENNSDCSAKP